MGPWVELSPGIARPTGTGTPAPALRDRLMALNLSLLKPVALFVPLAVCLSAAPSESRQTGNDLDQFMAQVQARRDDNWL
jgi:hypothetical protein